LLPSTHADERFMYFVVLFDADASDEDYLLVAFSTIFTKHSSHHGFSTSFTARRRTI
jgi:hypothetical protein